MTHTKTPKSKALTPLRRAALLALMFLLLVLAIGSITFWIMDVRDIWKASGITAAIVFAIATLVFEIVFPLLSLPDPWTKFWRKRKAQKKPD